MRDSLILLLLSFILFDQMIHRWDQGYMAGYSTGFQNGRKSGLAQKAQVWKTLASEAETS